MYIYTHIYMYVYICHILASSIFSMYILKLFSLHNLFRNNHNSGPKVYLLYIYIYMCIYIYFRYLHQIYFLCIFSNYSLCIICSGISIIRTPKFILYIYIYIQRVPKKYTHFKKGYNRMKIAILNLNG